MENGVQAAKCKIQSARCPPWKSWVFWRFIHDLTVANTLLWEEYTLTSRNCLKTHTCLEIITFFHLFRDKDTLLWAVQTTKSKVKKTTQFLKQTSSCFNLKWWPLRSRSDLPRTGHAPRTLAPHCWRMADGNGTVNTNKSKMGSCSNSGVWAVMMSESMKESKSDCNKKHVRQTKVLSTEWQVNRGRMDSKDDVQTLTQHSCSGSRLRSFSKDHVTSMQAGVPLSWA